MKKSRGDKNRSKRDAAKQKAPKLLAPTMDRRQAQHHAHAAPDSRVIYPNFQPPQPDTVSQVPYQSHLTSSESGSPPTTYIDPSLLTRRADQPSASVVPARPAIQPSTFAKPALPIVHTSTLVMDKRHPSSFQQLEKVSEKVQC